MKFIHPGTYQGYLLLLLYYYLYHSAKAHKDIACEVADMPSKDGANKDVVACETSSSEEACTSESEEDEK